MSIKAGLARTAARALATANGHDPDKVVVPGVPYLIAGKAVAAVGEAYFDAVAKPIWMMFLAEGEAAVAAILEDLGA